MTTDNDTVFDHDEVLRMRLRWPVVCRLACLAALSNVSFEELCNRAIAAYLGK